VITPGEHRVYVPQGWQFPPLPLLLVTVVGPAPLGSWRVRDRRNDISFVHANELHDPNDARGYPPLEEDATEAPPT
jgi:hypothetical protein